MGEQAASLFTGAQARRLCHQADTINSDIELAIPHFVRDGINTFIPAGGTSFLSFYT
jgi:hypothetical protein